MTQSNEHGTQSRIGRALATAAVALLCVAALGAPNPAFAEHGGGHGSGGSHSGGGGGGFHGGGGGGGFRGGGFHGGGFSGSSGGGGFAGMHSGGGGGFQGGSRGGFASVHRGFDRGGHFGRGVWWGGGVGTYYPSDTYYDQGQYSTSATWYYCADPAGYYPYVTQCYTGWQIVPAG